MSESAAPMSKRMKSPAAAIAWEFRQRHRWGLTALAVYLVVLAVVKFAIVASGRTVTLDSAPSFALVVVVPLATTFMYFLAVFSYGLAGDLAARQSMFPARLFTLPVTTGALAGWPMLYGTVAMALLWLATRLFAVWPSDFDDAGDLARAARRLAARLDAGADVDAVPAAGAARDRDGALAGGDRRHRAGRDRIQGSARP